MRKIRMKTVVCMFRFDITELGQLDFHEKRLKFQKQEVIVFSVLYWHLGVGLEK